jgi:hypothetical protein
VKKQDIAILEIAASLGKNKQHIFKVIDRLGIEKRLRKSNRARGEEDRLYLRR